MFSPLFSVMFCRYHWPMMFSAVPDYHMHTPRCNHATGSMRDYADVAIRHGLREIGISDHSPMPDGFDAEWRMQSDELDNYWQELETTRNYGKERGLKVRRALEIDFRSDQLAYTRSLIAQYPWDYVTGSVHYLGDWGFDNPDARQEWEHWSLQDAWVAYFDAVAASAESGLFDIIAHPDLMKKHGHCQPDDAQVEAAETRMLTAIRDAGCCLEISSAGLRKPVAEIYPRAAMIEHAAAMGIPFAYGSDAHAPQDVGHAMQDCLACLHRCGVRHIACFEQRQRTMMDFTR